MSGSIYKRKRDADLGSDDYSGGIESEMSKVVKLSGPSKHTIESDDSDEEEGAAGEEKRNKKKYDILNHEEIEGQEDEDESVDYEGSSGSRITPFNMRGEMEEGYFDGSGMYIWNKKDASQIKDSWLDSVDWMSVKKGDEKSKKSENKEEEEGGDESDDSLEAEDSVGSIALYKKCLSYLQPGENILKAIKRLGGGKQLSASERLKQKKLALKSGTSSSSSSSSSNLVDSSKNDAESITELTGLANKILSSTGNMDVYQESFESISHKIQQKESSKISGNEMPPPQPVDDGLDMFA